VYLDTFPAHSPKLKKRRIIESDDEDAAEPTLRFRKQPTHKGKEKQVVYDGDTTSGASGDEGIPGKDDEDISEDEEESAVAEAGAASKR
jgi:hypothetical protein